MNGSRDGRRKGRGRNIDRQREGGGNKKNRDIGSQEEGGRRREKREEDGRVFLKGALRRHKKIGNIVTFPCSPLAYPITARNTHWNEIIRKDCGSPFCLRKRPDTSTVAFAILPSLPLPFLPSAPFPSGAHELRSTDIYVRTWSTKGGNVISPFFIC